jgi:hypothetical protein
MKVQKDSLKVEYKKKKKKITVCFSLLEKMFVLATSHINDTTFLKRV